MKYIKLFNENFYIGPIYVAGDKGTDELNNTIAVPLNTFIYDDENKAFKKGQEDYKKGNINNPYKDVLYPNPNLIAAWENGFKSNKKRR